LDTTREITLVHPPSDTWHVDVDVYLQPPAIQTPGQNLRIYTPGYLDLTLGNCNKGENTFKLRFIPASFNTDI